MLHFHCQNEDAFAVEISCGTCGRRESYPFDPGVLLPAASASAMAQFEKSGWRFAVPIPVQRMAVTAKDNLGDPTAWGSKAGATIGDLCPECAGYESGENP